MDPFTVDDDTVLSDGKEDAMLLKVINVFGAWTTSIICLEGFFSAKYSKL
jgi:hypothetical protein